MIEVFSKRTRLNASAAVVFAWHAHPDALRKLVPPWEPVEVLERIGGIALGARVVLRIGRGPLKISWVARHTKYEENRMFQDVQDSGPFAFWEHTHRFEADGPDACFLEDTVRYTLPLAPLSHWIAGGLVRRKIQRMFDYRHEATRREVETR